MNARLIPETAGWLVYVYSNIMAFSPNHCSSGKTTLHIVCVAEIHVTVSYIKILRIAQKFFYGKFISPKTIVRLPYVM
jgi:hypothetical protein